MPGKGRKETKVRSTYKYQFKVGNKIVHGGITEDLERREQEHKQTWPKGHIKQVGRRTTVEAARTWERTHHTAAVRSGRALGLRHQYRLGREDGRGGKRATAG